MHGYSERIPRHQRYTLWQKCENTTLGILEGVIATSYDKGPERTAALQKISHKLDLLKVLIRLSYDTNTIHRAQYLVIQTSLKDVGKMLGGWIKFVPR